MAAVALVLEPLPAENTGGVPAAAAAQQPLEAAGAGDALPPAQGRDCAPREGACARCQQVQKAGEKTVQKSKNTWICAACNSVLSKLARRYGGFPEGWDSLTDQQRVGFFADAKSDQSALGLAYDRIESKLVDTLATATRQKRTHAEAGAFQPLSWWAQNGYDVEAVRTGAEVQDDKASQCCSTYTCLCMYIYTYTHTPTHIYPRARESMHVRLWSQVFGRTYRVPLTHVTDATEKEVVRQQLLQQEQKVKKQNKNKRRKLRDTTQETGEQAEGRQDLLDLLEDGILSEEVQQEVRGRQLCHRPQGSARGGASAGEAGAGGTEAS